MPSTVLSFQCDDEVIKIISAETNPRLTRSDLLREIIYDHYELTRKLPKRLCRRQQKRRPVAHPRATEVA